MANQAKENLVRRRPAESATVTAGTLAAVLTSTFGLAPRTAAIVTFCVGLIAPAYTFIVNHHGLVGFARELLHGRIAEQSEVQRAA